MMRGFTLQPVLDLAERKAEASLKLVKAAYAAWLRARAQLVRVERERQQQVENVSRMLQQGCLGQDVLRASTDLGARQDGYAAAVRAVKQARTEWERVLKQWEQENRRVEALKTLAKRHVIEQYRREQWRERRLHDELALRGAFGMRGWGQDKDISGLGSEREH